MLWNQKQEAYCKVMETVLFHDGYIHQVLTNIKMESQINCDLMSLQLIPTGKPLQIITNKDSSTNTIEESKDTFVHIAIQSL